MKEKILAQLTLPGGETAKDPTGFVNLSLENIISWGISAMFVVGTIMTLIYLIVGGIRWIGSGGDPENLTKARHTIIFALVGLGAILLSAFIVEFIAEDLLGIPLFDLTPSVGGGGGPPGKG